MTDEMGYEPPVPPAPTSPAVAPGWYPLGDGNQRYWDGARWTEHIVPGLPGVPGLPDVPGRPGVTAATNDDHTMGMLVHLLALFTGFIGPLVLWLIKKDESAYIDYHGKEALNFQITMFIAFLVAFVLVFVLIGFLLLPLLFLGNIIFPILAAVAANRGEYYRYPISLRIIT